jgi:hypothetical protein
MVVGQQKGLQVLVKFVSTLVKEALDGRFFDGAVHALHLAVSPRVGWSGQSVLHAIFAADAVKAVFVRQELMWLGSEMQPIVGQGGVYFIR